MILTKEQQAELNRRLNRSMIAVSIGGALAGYALAQGWVIAGLLAYGLGLAFGGFEWHTPKP